MHQVRRRLLNLCPRKGKSKDIKCMLCEGNRPANYKSKSYMIYKDLQRFPCITEKSINIQNTITNLNCKHIRLQKNSMLQSQELKEDNRLYTKIIKH
jgi:hypothetical protein